MNYKHNVPKRLKKDFITVKDMSKLKYTQVVEEDQKILQVEWRFLMKVCGHS